MRKYQTDKLTLMPIDMPYGEYKFMSRDHHLLERIDSAYVALRAADKLQPIQNKWFYPDRRDTGIPAWVWHLAATLAVIAVILLFYYIFYRVRERRLTQARAKDSRVRPSTPSCIATGPRMCNGSSGPSRISPRRRKSM